MNIHSICLACLRESNQRIQGFEIGIILTSQSLSPSHINQSSNKKLYQLLPFTSICFPLHKGPKPHSFLWPSKQDSYGNQESLGKQRGIGTDPSKNVCIEELAYAWKLGGSGSAKVKGEAAWLHMWVKLCHKRRDAAVSHADRIVKNLLRCWQDFTYSFLNNLIILLWRWWDLKGVDWRKDFFV